MTFSIPVKSISRIVDDIGAKWDKDIAFEKIRKAIEERIIMERLDILPEMNLGVSTPGWEDDVPHVAYVVGIITMVLTTNVWGAIIAAVIGGTVTGASKEYVRKQRIAEAHEYLQNTRT